MENELKKYQKIEKAFFNHLNRNLKDELIFYCVTGSLSRKDIILGWSDIDVLLVFNEYSEKVFGVISQALKENNSGIKIGTTFYSLDEFTSKNIFKDPKTIYAIELIKDHIYKPRKSNTVIDRKLKYLVNLKFYLWSYIISFTMILHEYKRALILTDNFNEKKACKHLNTILKILLIRKGVRALGYKDVLEQSRKHLKGFDFKIELPEEILRDKKHIKERKKEYIRILNWLKEYKYA